MSFQRYHPVCRVDKDRPLALNGYPSAANHFELRAKSRSNIDE